MYKMRMHAGAIREKLYGCAKARGLSTSTYAQTLTNNLHLYHLSKLRPIIINRNEIIVYSYLFISRLRC